MFKLILSPKELFKIENWFKGYIFEPMYKLAYSEYVNIFSLIFNSETWIIEVIYNFIDLNNTIQLKYGIINTKNSDDTVKTEFIPKQIQKLIESHVKRYLGQNIILMSKENKYTNY